MRAKGGGEESRLTTVGKLPDDAGGGGGGAYQNHDQGVINVLHAQHAVSLSVAMHLQRRFAMLIQVLRAQEERYKAGCMGGGWE